VCLCLCVCESGCECVCACVRNALSPSFSFFSSPSLSPSLPLSLSFLLFILCFKLTVVDLPVGIVCAVNALFSVVTDRQHAYWKVCLFVCACVHEKDSDRERVHVCVVHMCVSVYEFI